MQNRTFYQRMNEPIVTPNMAQVRPLGTLIANMAATDMRTPSQRRTASQAGQKYGKNHRPEFARFKLAAYFKGMNDDAHSPYASIDTYYRHENKVKHKITDERRGLKALWKLASERLPYKSKNPYKSLVIYANLTDDIRTNSDNYDYMINEFRDGKWQYAWKVVPWMKDDTLLDIGKIRELNADKWDNKGMPRPQYFNQLKLIA